MIYLWIFSVLALCVAIVTATHKIVQFYSLRKTLQNQQGQIKDYLETLLDLKQSIEGERKLLEEDRIKDQLNYEMLVTQNTTLRQQKKQIKQIYNQNQDVIKRNETFLYSIKENTLNTIQDYKEVTKILSSSITEYDPEKMYVHLSLLQSKIAQMQNYFKETFRQTPEQYLQAKQELNDNKFFLN